MTYRLYGRNGGERYVEFVVSGERGTLSNHFLDQFAINADGTFEIAFCREPQPGNWLPMPEGALSLLVRQIESEKLPAAEAFGMGVLPYFPLASGLLTGKYKRGVEAAAETRFANLQGLAKRYLTDANWARVEQLEAFCVKRGHTLLELAFSWLLARPAVASVIAGATKPEQVETNVNAVNWRLAPEDLTEIDRLTLPA